MSENPELGMCGKWCTSRQSVCDDLEKRQPVALE